MIQKKVVIFELTDVKYASRARKEAFSLAKAGYNVTFIGTTKMNNKKIISYENDVQLITFPVNSNRKIINLFIFNFHLFFFLIKNKFDIYHLHNLNSVFVAVLFKKFSGRKLIFDAHELNYHKRHNGESLRNKLVTAIDVFKERVLLIFSDIIIQANNKRAELFAEHYNCKKPEVIENNEPIITIDNSKSIRNTIEIPEKQIIMIFTGNITIGINQKVDKIIEALKDIRKDVHYYMLGNVSEWTKEILLKIAEENGVKNRVHFLNSIPYNDVVHFISGADLAVVPIYATSLNSEHSALNKISQALMAGLPLVTSNYNNLNNLINNDSYYIGETFDVTDSLSIANAVNRLLEKNLSVVKETSRKIALEKVNWDSENEKLLKIYIELFKPRKKSKHV